jgi:hypothetical protein
LGSTTELVKEKLGDDRCDYTVGQSASVTAATSTPANAAAAPFFVESAESTRTT